MHDVVIGEAPEELEGCRRDLPGVARSDPTPVARYQGEFPCYSCCPYGALRGGAVKVNVHARRLRRAGQ